MAEATLQEMQTAHPTVEQVQPQMLPALQDALTKLGVGKMDTDLLRFHKVETDGLTNDALKENRLGGINIITYDADGKKDGQAANYKTRSRNEDIVIYGPGGSLIILELYQGEIKGENKLRFIHTAYEAPGKYPRNKMSRVNMESLINPSLWILVKHEDPKGPIATTLIADSNWQEAFGVDGYLRKT